MEMSGPSFIILPTEPLTCLAVSNRQTSLTNSGMLSVNEFSQLLFLFPKHQKGWTTYPHPKSSTRSSLQTSTTFGSFPDCPAVKVSSVCVPERESLAGSPDSRGTFLTANPSGTLTADTPSRGPLESFTPSVLPPSSSSPGPGLQHPFPTLTLETAAKTYLSYSKPVASVPSKLAFEVRCDGEEAGSKEKWIVKCQREYVYKARLEASGVKMKKKAGDGTIGTLEDEIEKKYELVNHADSSRQVHGWSLGRSVVSQADRKDIKKARKEGRVAEAMLDRRAAMKR